MTMTNDVLEQLNYLKLKSAYSYLNSLVMNNEIAEEELHVMHKILNKEVIAKEENNRLYNVKVAAFPFLRKVDDYDFNFQPGIKEEKIRSKRPQNAKTTKPILTAPIKDAVFIINNR